ncbi:esterase-like activity of phytase family protein [Mariniblastus fucicola]|uniref:Phytase-like domain-containing protein n=1 Tax=Mariniblastus fucicola TaxID=980251 RepID=A0A5B9PFM9_9BACT|nr:esterase-like activity of phytase family protein [Mariniblastus fucicola]QEG25248.1 hypothetical protein MFFC18_51720 [Mariniblastus fucicola]
MQNSRLRFTLVAALAVCFGPASVLLSDVVANENEVPSVKFLGVAEIAGDAVDLSGLNQTLVPTEGTSSDVVPDGRTFSNNMLGGISAITWTGEGDVYWMLPDRGPLDGAVDWYCRVQKVRVIVDAEGDSPVRTELIETVLLRDKRGMAFTGYASAFEPSDNRTQRLDPEGIRVGANGNFFISDEYGPRVIEFAADGSFVQEFEVPQRYLVANPDVSKPTENPKNHSGRATNRGMEGLAISADGQRLFGLMQSPLLQDAHRATLEDKPKGLNCRLPSFNVDGEFGEEFLYHLDAESNKLNEILSCGANRFVVIERDGEAGDEAKFKKLMLVSTKSASDVSSIDQLPATELPSDVTPVAKSELIDLLDERWGLSGEKMPEKIEGLAFGPNVDAQHRLLLVASDNDFIPEQATVIYAFAVPVSALER